MAQSGTDAIDWFTDWLPAIAMDAATATLKLANVSGGFRAQPVVQTAVARTDKPSAATAIRTLKDASDEYFFSEADFDLDALTAGRTFVRFGVAYDVSSTPSLGQADVTLQLALRQCGKLLPPWSGHLATTTDADQFVAFTGWLPALGVTKVEGTIVVSSMTGSFQLILTYRTAVASPKLPGAWDPTGIGAAVTATGETNTGELAVTTTGKMWIQIGGRYDLTAGSLAQADVSVVVGVRSSG